MEEQYQADMEAIRHELEAVWEAINELQGIDPGEAGKPHGKKQIKLFSNRREWLTWKRLQRLLK